MKTVSAGTIILVKDKILIGHVTGNDHWDLPKGGVEEDESYIDAAIRECYEEFGINLEKDKLTPIGTFWYKPKKDLALYFYYLDEVNLEALYCCSFVKPDYPEIDKYELVSLKELKNRVSKVMDRCFEKENIYKFIENRINL